MCIRDRAHGVPRVITDGVVEGNYYPNHVGIDLSLIHILGQLILG